MSKTSFQGGLELKIFESATFEALDVPLEEQPLVTARNVVRFLMMGWPKSWMSLFSWPVLKAIFIQQNLVLLRALRAAFQQGFYNLFHQLSTLNLTELQKEQVQLYLSNCLSLLPYADLTFDELIKIPQLVDECWELVDYHVTAIELTAVDQCQDCDRVFAYGLQAATQKKARSHLIFMGTTYPADQGFMTQIDANFKAFEYVGASLYRSGKNNIALWIKSQPHKVHVCGISLGGALSLLCALDLGEFIERVDAQSAPGITPNNKKNLWHAWDKLGSKPKIVIQSQGCDPVSNLGLWHEEWQIIRVQPPKYKQGPNSFCDHFLNYAGFAETTFTYCSAKEENLNRGYRNFLLFFIGRGLFYYSIIWPYKKLLRPLLNYIEKQTNKKVIFCLLGLSIGLLLVLTSASTVLKWILTSNLLACCFFYFKK